MEKFSLYSDSIILLRSRSILGTKTTEIGSMTTNFKLPHHKLN